MLFYKDLQNNIHSIESADFVYLLPVGSVEIAEQEAEVLANPVPSIQHQVDTLKIEIDAIERADLMNRRAREAFLLQAESIAAAQYNLTPTQLYALNPGYKGAKDVDDQCAALRSQIDALKAQL